jgi:hypothetical protein
MLELQKLSPFFCAENLQMTVYRHETADSVGVPTPNSLLAAAILCGHLGATRLWSHSKSIVWR